MGRKLRDFNPNCKYHIYSRGVEKRNIFLDNMDYYTFLSIANRVFNQYPFKVDAYCLMPNHYHLVMENLETPLSRVMYQINKNYVQYFNIKYKRVGPLFQSRFQAKYIEDDFYNQHIIDYVHFNPVKDGFVNTPTEWKWSSYSHFNKGEKQKYAFLRN